MLAEVPTEVLHPLFRQALQDHHSGSAARLLRLLRTARIDGDAPTLVRFLHLVQPADVLEAALIGLTDEHGLTRPKAYVVLKDRSLAGEALAEELKAFVKSRLAPHKYPRLLEFIDELPKTATGKIQRFRLREREATGT